MYYCEDPDEAQVGHLDIDRHSHHLCGLAGAWTCRAVLPIRGEASVVTLRVLLYACNFFQLRSQSGSNLAGDFCFRYVEGIELFDHKYFQIQINEAARGRCSQHSHGHN